MCIFMFNLTCFLSKCYNKSTFSFGGQAMDPMMQLESEQVTSIESLLRHVSTVIRRRGRNILSDFSITPPQFDALLFLDEHGDLTIGELSNKMYLAYSTTTDLVDRM